MNNGRACFTGFAECHRDAGAESRSGEFQPSHPRRRTCGDSGTERLRQIDSDQDNHARMLSRSPGRLVNDHSGAGALGCFRTAFAAGHCFERSDVRSALARLVGGTWFCPDSSAAPAFFRITLSIRSTANWRKLLWPNCRYRTWRTAGCGNVVREKHAVYSSPAPWFTNRER